MAGLVYERVLALDAKTNQSKREFDVNGYLRVSESPFTKEQVVKYYGYEIPDWEKHRLQPHKLYRVYRPAEELSRPETVASMNCIPIQLEHHIEDPNDPPKDTRIGATGTDARWVPPYIMNSLAIYDTKAIKRILDGSMRELSLGYWYKPEIKAGKTKDGHSYDIIMRNIIANHLALVEEGRAGHDVMVMDSLSALKKQGVKHMDNEKLKELLNQQMNTLQAMLALMPGNGTDDPAALDEDENGMTQEDESQDPVAQDGDNCVTKDSDPDMAKDEGEDDLTEDEDEESSASENLSEDEDEDLTEDEDEESSASENLSEDEDEDLTEDEDEEDLTKDGELTDEMIAKALQKVGFEEAPDEIKKAFIRGMQAVKEVHDNMAKDSARYIRKKLIPNVTKQISSEVKKDLSARYRAANDTKNILGNVNPMAFDSAASIYQKALKKMGVTSNLKDARIAFKAYSRGLAKAKVQRMAQDSRAKRKATQEDSLLQTVSSRVQLF